MNMIKEPRKEREQGEDKVGELRISVMGVRSSGSNVWTDVSAEIASPLRWRYKWSPKHWQCSVNQHVAVTQKTGTKLALNNHERLEFSVTWSAT